MSNHYNLKVKGRVQGVFFRASTQQEALSLGLAGFVRNELDGTVYIEVEGEQEEINSLIAWIKNGGPPQGSVDGFEMIESEIEGYLDFEIR